MADPVLGTQNKARDEYDQDVHCRAVLVWNQTSSFECTLLAPSSKQRHRHQINFLSALEGKSWRIKLMNEPLGLPYPAPFPNRTPTVRTGTRLAYVLAPPMIGKNVSKRITCCFFRHASNFDTAEKKALRGLCGNLPLHTETGDVQQ